MILHNTKLNRKILQKGVIEVKNNKITTVLITGKNTRQLNRLDQLVRRSLPAPIRVNKKMRIDKAKEALLGGRIDISIIAEKLADGYGEELAALIDEHYDEHPIIYYLDQEDISHRVKLYDKYDNIKCVVLDAVFSGVGELLLHAYRKLGKYLQRRFSFSKVDAIKSAGLYEIPTIEVVGYMLEFEIYDWDKKLFRYEEKKMSLKSYMDDYNDNEDFIQVNSSKAVNVHYIDRVEREGRYLVLIIPDGNGDEYQIGITETYYKNVCKRMKGWYGNE